MNVNCMRVGIWANHIVSSMNLSDLLGKSEEAKAELSYQIESLRKELFEKDSNRENIYDEVKSKAQHWKVSLHIV